MKLFKSIKRIVILGLFCVCILDTNTAVTSSKDAVRLCFESLIPSLFPLMVLSNIARSQLVGSNGLRYIGHLFHLPEGYEGILPSAFLAGYPIGAAAIGSDYHKGILVKEEAQRLLNFCSNAGPAFIFGIVSHYFFKMQTLFAIWFIQLYSAWFICRLGNRHQNIIASGEQKVTSVSESIKTASNAMIQLCSWVIVFKVLLAYMCKYLLTKVPSNFLVLVVGITELSNGCLLLSCIENRELRFLICNFIIAFGGLCVAMQTKDFIYDLSLKKYLYAKALQAFIAVVLGMLYLYLDIIPLVLIFVVLSIILITRKKIVDFICILMYNQRNKDRRTQHVVS